MSSISQIASKEGLFFEKKLYNTITEHFECFTIRQEKDIKKEYGDDTCGIDMEIFKTSTDLEDNKHIFIQLKWKCKPDSIKNINHFIHGCNQIIKQKTLDEKSVLHIYGTKVPISKPSLCALNKLNLSENITYENMEICILAITNKCLEFFNKKEIKSTDLINIPQIIPKVNNKIITMMIDNKEYSLTYIYGIDIYTHVNNGTCDKNKSDYDVVKEANEWIKYLDNQNEYIQNIHTNQSSRQLRFYTDKYGNIIGAGCKDNINIFTDYELDMICRIINEVLDDINLNNYQ